MKKTIAILVAAFMIFTLVACGGGAGGGEGASSSGAVYTVDVEELDPTVYPDDYPLIPSGDFEAALNVMRDANMAGELKIIKTLLIFSLELMVLITRIAILIMAVNCINIMDGMEIVVEVC